MDELLEIRFQALNELKHLNPQDKDQLLILLYNHLHCDDLKKVSETISQQFFPFQQELLSIIHQKKLNECIIHCFYSTISRNWKIRRSGLKTLLSIVLHCQNRDLPINEILKVAQNCTLFETDFNVKYYGFRLMYQIIILDQNQITQFQDQIIQNCLFNFSDDSQECQELCLKILINLISYQNLIPQLILKTDQILNKELAYKDLKEKIQIMEKFQKQSLNQSFSEEIKEEKIIKHQLNIFLGIILCLIQIIKFKFDEKTLHQVIQMICQGLQIKILQQEVVYNFLLNQLKQIQMQQKELVINLIIQSNLIDILRSNNEIEVGHQF
ncbi:unnamed protein product [Paramecium sonneborni]|uniref:Uncharacterized protein n=1 Tax=Paramecium sonneborni TaxID=65129 RepID=A0A8S1QGQ7_9CILI|nr:unnamed protein product [Paramecium sonneborni]